MGQAWKAVERVNTKARHESKNCVSKPALTRGKKCKHTLRGEHYGDGYGTMADDAVGAVSKSG